VGAALAPNESTYTLRGWRGAAGRGGLWLKNWLLKVFGTKALIRFLEYLDHIFEQKVAIAVGLA